jgi:hypothetical protein
VQDAFLKSDISDDGLTRAFTGMGIRCNPDAPKQVPKEVIDPLLAVDPGRRKKIQNDLRKRLTNGTRSFEQDMEKSDAEDYFFRIYHGIPRHWLETSPPHPSNSDFERSVLYSKLTSLVGQAPAGTRSVADARLQQTLAYNHQNISFSDSYKYPNPHMFQ